MKHKNFMVTLLFAVIIGIGVWWFTRPMTAVLEKTAAKPMPAQVDWPQPTKQVAQVEPPKLPPATPKPADAAPDSADPQSDLKTAIPELARLARAGDTLVIYETFTRPDKVDPQTIQMLQSLQKKLDNSFDELNAQVRALYPESQQQVQQQEQQLKEQSHDRTAKRWESLESQTPTFNATRDEATYMVHQVIRSDWINHNLDNPSGPLVPVVFIKINGKWYLDNQETAN